MSTTESRSEYEVRSDKRRALLAAGIPPYANGFAKGYTIAELRTIGESKELPAGEKLLTSGAKPAYTTAGRLMTFRTHGKLSFATIQDSTETIQVAFVRDLCELIVGEESHAQIEIDGETVSAYKFVDKRIDPGDFVGLRGELFVTKHGELTLLVESFELLTKALRPLGDKRHGIRDQEALYRQRYLDLTMNSESYARFQLRSDLIKALREFYRSQGFTEIETPILGSAASGAAAKPFVTHHADFDEEFYLRIATEIGLKKATVGRFERLFEIGKQFRNEGSDPSHLQEFTSVEHYTAYRTYEDNMDFTTQLFDYLFDQLGLDPIVPVRDKQGTIKEVDFSSPREKIDYIEGVKRASGIDITAYGPDEADRLRADIEAAGHTRVGIETMGVPSLIDYLYKKVLRPEIVGPAFVYNYPATMQPLARAKETDPTIVEQFQVVVNGREIVKAYSELVDPVLQEENFAAQAAALASGDEEATSGDPSFVEAMEYGMPPQSGWGMGIDRIITLLTQQDNLRDSILFPLMKPISTDQVAREGDLHEPVRHYGTLPSREAAHQLVDAYLTDTKQHCLQVAHVMQRFADQLDQDPHLWYLAGLLHDIDRDHIDKDPTKHLGEQFEQIVSEIALSDDLIDDIRSHYTEQTGVPIDSLLRKYLASVDELTGFIHAYSLMRPTGLEGMKAKSVIKKIKDKSFAAGVDRDHLKQCEQLLDISLREFIPQVIQALSTAESDS